MTRITYKDTLRIKGIRPIPPMCVLRSSVRERHDHITHDGKVAA